MRIRFALLPTALFFAACGGDGADTDAATPLDAPQVSFVADAPTTADDLEVVIGNEASGVSYRFAWMRDGEAVDADEAVLPSSFTARGESWAVEVTAVRGEQRESGAASVTIVNAPPIITATITPQDPDATVPLVVDYEVNDPDGDEVTLTWSWRVDGVGAVIDGPEVDAISTSRGETWSVSVTGNDGIERGEPATDEVTIGNARPFVTDAYITPENPTRSTPLNAVTTQVDPDGDPTTRSFVWFIDGASQTVSGSTFPAGVASKGQEVHFQVTVSDGVEVSEPFMSPAVTIGNLPPAITGVNLSPPNPTSADTLVCEPQGWTDPDGDDEGYIFRWRVAGVDVPDADGPTLAGAFRRGEIVQCFATPTDGEAEGAEFSSQAVTLLNGPPRVFAVNYLPASPTATANLFASVAGFEDPDDDTVSFSFAWRVNGVEVASGQTLNSSFTSADDEVQVVVTPSDPFTSGTPFEAPLITINNTAPVVSNAQLSPGNPTTTTTLSATWDVWDPDGQVVTSSVEWLRDGVVVPGATEAQLPPAETSRGQEIQARITANDGLADGMPRLTPMVVIRNTPPAADAAQIAPSVAYTDSDLTCQGVGWSDPDGDPEAYDFAWVIGPGVVATGPTLSADQHQKNQSVVCRATPNDGIDEGSTRISAPVVIRNTPPTLSSAQLSHTEVDANTTLTVIKGDTFDLDGDPVQVQIDWYVNDAFVTAAEALSGAAWRAGDIIYADAIPYDGTGFGVPVRTNSAVALNTPPFISQARLDPQQPKGSDDLVITAEASDVDDDPLTVTYTWFIDGNEVQSGTSNVLEAAAIAKNQSITATVVAFDGFESSVPFTLGPVQVRNAPPVASGARIEPEAPRTANALTCVGEGYEDPDGDAEGWRYTWFINGEEIPFGMNLPANQTEKADVISCRATPDDGDLGGLGVPVVSPEVVVRNTPPSLGGATLTKAEATALDEVGVNVTGIFDADGDEVELRYAWYIGGVQVSDEATVTGNDFSRDLEYYVVVTPFDGEDEGEPVTSNTGVALNSPPVVLSVAIDPENPLADDDIQAVVITQDADGDPVTLTYFWEADGVLLQSGSNDTITSGVYAAGDRITLTVVPNDGTVDGASVSFGPFLVGNTPPEMDAASITPDPARTSDVLTCEPIGWFDADGDPPDYRFRWLVNGVSRGTNPTLANQITKKGDAIICEVTPFDGTSTGDPVSSPTLVIQNTPPTATGASLNTSNPRTNQTLSVILSGVFDADADPLTMSYQWFVNDSPAGTAAQLPPSAHQRDDEVRAAINISDGEAAIDLFTPAVTVVNSPPLVQQLTLTPSNASSADDVVAVASGSDADADPVSFTYAWTINGSAVPDVAGDTLSAGLIIRGDRVRVTATPNDGFVNGNPASAGPIEIRNSPPVLSEVVVSPSVAYTDTPLFCVPGATSDADADSVSLSYRWNINGSPTNLTSPILTASNTTRGQSITCTVTPTDGIDAGFPVTSDPVVIQNSKPRIDFARIDPDNATAGAAMQANVINPFDADGDPITYTYQWFHEGSPVSTNRVLLGDGFVRGDLVRLIVTPFDGFEQGDPKEHTISIQNTPPAIEGPVSVTPSVIARGTAATASASASDVDGDPITFTYVWRVNGFVVQSGSSDTLPGFSAWKGDTLTATVIPDDGFAQGVPRTSSDIIIANTPPGPPSVAVNPTTVAPQNEDVSCARVTPGNDLDGDPLTYEIRWRRYEGGTGSGEVVFPEAEGGVPATGDISVLPAQAMHAGDIFRCDARSHDGSAWGAWGSYATLTVGTGTGTLDPVLEASRTAVWPDCQVHLDEGNPSGAALLMGASAPYDAWCEHDVADGGWAMLMLTDGTAHSLGQASPALYDPAASTPTTAVYEAFAQLTGLEELLLVQLDGPQAGAWARYSLADAAQGLSLVDVLGTCLDEPLPPDGYDASPLAGHQSAPAGAWVEGALLVDTPAGPQAPEALHLCGVSDSSDLAWYLAALHPSAWDAPLWAYAGGPPGPYGTCPLGTPWLTALAGWQGGDDAAWLHEGSYALYGR